MSNHTMAVPAVAFVASADFIEALDLAAAAHGETRSHFASKILTSRLREDGLLDPEAPVTTHAARRRSRREVVR